MSNTFENTRTNAQDLAKLANMDGTVAWQAGRAPMGDPFTAYKGLTHARNLCHALAHRAGWWTDLATGEPIDRHNPLVVSQKLLLIHSEISEAMEGHRKALRDDHLPGRDMFEVELADAMIRIFDLAGAMELDLAGALIDKLAYNRQRADHKPENRGGEHGKAY